MKSVQEPVEANWWFVTAGMLTVAAVFVLAIVVSWQTIPQWQFIGLVLIMAGFFALQARLMMGGEMTPNGYRLIFGVLTLLAIPPFFWVPNSSGYMPILFVLVISQSYFMFDTREAVYWTFGLLVVIAVMLLMSSDVTSSLFSAVLYAGVTIFLATTMLALKREQESRAITERLLRELEDANTQLREYAARVQELAVAEERTRLAREIHDSLGHHLTVLSVQLQAAGKLVERDPARAVQEIENARNVVSVALRDVRQSVGALRDNSATELRPAQALPELVKNFGAATGIETKYHAENFSAADALAPAQAFTIYRAVQEGLTNAQKHGQPGHIDVTVENEKSLLRVVVRDDGAAQPQTETHGSGFGLMGLRERVQLLGGTLNAAPCSDGGFELRVELPIESLAVD